jgi:hypothetical protein
MSIAVPSTGQGAVLLFVVAHGAVVWWSIWALSILIATGSVVWHARVKARRRQRDRLDELRQHLVGADGLVDGVRATLRARLVGPPEAAPASLWFLGRREGSRHAAAAAGTWCARRGLALEVDGPPGSTPRRVELDGPLRVQVGCEIAGRLGLDDAFVAPHRDEVQALQGSAPWIRLPVARGRAGVSSAEIHRIAPGASVLASGRLAVAPARDHAGGYRDTAAQWTLRGDVDDPIELASQAGALPPRRASRWGRALLLGLALGYPLLWGAGRYCLHLHGGSPTAEQLGGATRGVELSITDPIVIAAAMPGSRDRALGIMRDGLAEHPHPDGQAVALLAWLSRVAGGCDDEIEVWLDYRQYETAAARARGCGDAASAVDASLALGDYARAADHAVRDRKKNGTSLAGMVALIGAGRYADAAEGARWLARERRSPRSQPSAGAIEQATAAECLALYLDHRAGKPGALALLARLARGRDGRMCGPLYMDLLDAGRGAEYLAIWRSLDPVASDGSAGDVPLGEAMELLALLSGAAAGMDVLDAVDRDFGDHRLAFAVIDQPWMGVHGPSVRLAPSLVAALEAKPRRSQLEEKALAAYDAVRVALLTIENPRRGVDQLGRLRGRALRVEWLETLATSMETRTGARDGSTLLGDGDPRDVARKRVIDDALAGDGRPLAEWVQRERKDLDDVPLLALAPRLRQGREVLAELWSWEENDPLSARGGPCDRALHAAWLRDVHGGLGDEVRRKHRDRMAQRHMAVCTARETAIPLWYVEEVLVVL